MAGKRELGKLSIVGTPIGNLEDISLRALRILKEADYILCEDTRVTKKLLSHHNIGTPTISYHQHSGAPKIDKIISLLAAGKKLALVTDAGTPGISDPGGYLVSAIREALTEKVEIESVPGPTALTAAISLAGIGFDRFFFLGFPPHKKGRQTMMREIVVSNYPVIVYESKHRATRFLEELTVASQEKGREVIVSVARELTKMHESFYQGSPEAVLEEIESDANNLKGEFVIMIRPKKKVQTS